MRSRRATVVAQRRGRGQRDGPVAGARNAYGRQAASFAAEVSVVDWGEPFRAVFIRAPRITAVGPGVEVLARHAVAIALATVAGLLAGVLAGEAHMALGMLVHQGSVLLVVANALRLTWGGGAGSDRPGAAPAAPAASGPARVRVAAAARMGGAP